MDGFQHLVQRVTDIQPLPMPDQKPNLNKQVYSKISHIDIHNYLKFWTLENLKPFQLVSQNTVPFVDAGKVPLTHGEFTTI